MSTTFEFTQTEVKKPSPPITSILDFINGDGSEGIAPQEETTREGEHFHSLLPIESPQQEVSPPWENPETSSGQPTDELIEAIKFSTEKELLAYWLQTNGYDDTGKLTTKEAIAEATAWAKQFIADTAEQATKSSVEQVSKLLDPASEQLAEPTHFEFCMSESIDLDSTSPPRDQVTDVLPADYAKLYQAAIEKWKEDCFRAESDHKVRLEKLRNDQTDAAIAIDEAVDVVKENKKIHKAILARLRSAIAFGAMFPDRPSMPAVIEANEIEDSEIEASESTQVKADGTVKTKSVAPNVDNTWRKIPTSEVLGESMDGLGPKKRELLIEHFATLGDLEDARGKASIAYKNFSEFLPEGFGKELAGRIEDAMLEASGKHWPELAGVQGKS